MAMILGGTTGVTFNDTTTQSTAALPPTAGNGISVTAGAVAVACPGANTVGSYAGVAWLRGSGSYNRTIGATVAAGNGTNQVLAGGFEGRQAVGQAASINWQDSSISGTWQIMGYVAGDNIGDHGFTMACRIS